MIIAPLLSLFYGWGRGGTKVKLATKFSHSWGIMEHEFQACCLARGSVLSPTVTPRGGFCLYLCVIMCVWESEFQRVHTPQWLFVCPWVRMSVCVTGAPSDVTFSVWPSLTHPPFEIINSPAYSSSTTNKSLTHNIVYFSHLCMPPQ